MLNIGCHLSSSKGYLHMGKEALSIGANTFQYFTRNPRGSKAKAVNFADIAAFNNLAEQEHFSTLVAHAPIPSTSVPQTRASGSLPSKL